MKATISGKIEYDSNGWYRVKRKLVLDKPIPFTHIDGKVEMLNSILIPDGMDDVMETMFDRYIEYDSKFKCPITISIELDDKVLKPITKHNYKQ